MSRGAIRKLTALDVTLESPSSVVEKDCWEELVLVGEGEGEYGGEEGWGEVGGKYSYRSKGNYLRWAVGEVVPCQEHTVRLYLGNQYIQVFTPQTIINAQS